MSQPNHLESAEFESATAELFDFIRIPSVSADSKHAPDVARTAEFLCLKLESLGFEARVDATEGHPVVFAQKIVSFEKPTVLIYGHYDVQPPDPLELWTSPAFEPTVRNGRIYARGATDDKGQVYAHVRGVQHALEAGELPVNVKFLIEGEEEIGSPNLEKYIYAHTQDLACDIIAISDGSRFAPDIPSITYGVRGLSYIEVHVEGADRDLHSGTYGGSAPNPINALCQMVAQLQDKEGRVTVPGFYDGILELTAEERAAWALLPFDEREFADSIGATDLIGETGYSALEHTWGRPTLDCNGIWGGYQGEGSKTVIPSKAAAKISCRLVPGQDPHRITKLLLEHIPTLAPKGIKVHAFEHHGGTPLVMDTSSPYFEAATRAVERAFGRPPVFIRTGGSIPIALALKTALSSEIIFLDLGLNEDNLHSPNESFALEDYKRGILVSSYLLEEIGAVSAGI